MINIVWLYRKDKERLSKELGEMVWGKKLSKDTYANEMTKDV